MQPTDIASSLFLTLLMLSAGAASAFTFEAPSEAAVEENITVTIKGTERETYDVKLFILAESTVSSQTYASGWKSSFFYLPNAFPSQKEYIVRPLTPAQNASLCLRFRQAGKQAYEEYCRPITIYPFPSGSLSKNDSGESSVSSEETPQVLNLARTPTATFQTLEYKVHQALVIISLALFPLTCAALVFFWWKQRIYSERRK